MIGDDKDIALPMPRKAVVPEATQREEVEAPAPHASITLNGKPHLMKAFRVSDPGEAIQQVRLSLGINLAGGVTLDHVRCQIFEIRGHMRTFRPEFQ